MDFNLTLLDNMHKQYADAPEKLAAIIKNADGYLNEFEWVDRGYADCSNIYVGQTLLYI